MVLTITAQHLTAKKGFNLTSPDPNDADSFAGIVPASAVFNFILLRLFHPEFGFFTHKIPFTGMFIFIAT